MSKVAAAVCLFSIPGEGMNFNFTSNEKGAPKRQPQIDFNKMRTKYHIRKREEHNPFQAKMSKKYKLKTRKSFSVVSNELRKENNGHSHQNRSNSNSVVRRFKMKKPARQEKSYTCYSKIRRRSHSTNKSINRKKIKITRIKRKSIKSNVTTSQSQCGQKGMGSNRKSRYNQKGSTPKKKVLPKNPPRLRGASNAPYSLYLKTQSRRGGVNTSSKLNMSCLKTTQYTLGNPMLQTISTLVTPKGPHSQVVSRRKRKSIQYYKKLALKTDAKRQAMQDLRPTNDQQLIHDVREKMERNKIRHSINQKYKIKGWHKSRNEIPTTHHIYKHFKQHVHYKFVGGKARSKLRQKQEKAKQEELKAEKKKKNDSLMLLLDFRREIWRYLPTKDEIRHVTKKMEKNDSRELWISIWNEVLEKRGLQERTWSTKDSKNYEEAVIIYDNISDACRKLKKVSRGLIGELRWNNDNLHRAELPFNGKKLKLDKGLLEDCCEKIDKLREDVEKDAKLKKNLQDFYEKLSTKKGGRANTPSSETSGEVRLKYIKRVEEITAKFLKVFKRVVEIHEDEKQTLELTDDEFNKVYKDYMKAAKWTRKVQWQLLEADETTRRELDQIFAELKKQCEEAAKGRFDAGDKTQEESLPKTQKSLRCILRQLTEIVENI